MSPEVEKEYESLRVAYKDIVKGYSFSPKLKLYIKHVDEFDISSLFEEKGILLLRQASELPTEAARKKTLVESGAWSDADDEKLLELEIQIKDNESFVSKIPIQAQKDALLHRVNELKAELFKWKRKRNEAFGPTLEDFVERTANNNLMLRSFYLDADLKKKAITDEQIDEMYEEDFDNYLTEYNSSTSKFSDKNIYKIACLSFVISPLSYVKDRPESFFGKPMANLSLYQFSLISFGIRNLQSMSEGKSEPPTLNTIKSLDELTKWYDVQYSILMGKRGGDDHGIKKSRKTVTK